MANRERARPRRSRRGRQAALLAGALLVVAAAGLAARRFLASSDRRPWNVLLITVDTLRADRLGAYGYEGARSPTIDGLARDGVLFESCVSPAPLTLPSHTSLLSGTYPLHHGIRDNGSFVVPPALPTLATLLSAKGYRTAAAIGAFVLDSRWGLNRGFAEYFDQFDTHQSNLTSIGDIQRPADQVVDRALAWLDRRPKGPFFLWAHFYDPHDPYEPPPPYREQFAQRPYDGEIAFTDAQIGRLLGELERRDPDPLLVVFAGDHGESLGEHEESGHGFFAYESTLRVPLLFRLPGRESAGTRRTETVSLVDVLPTVTDLLRLPPPAGIQGQSLAPLLRGSRGFVERPVYAETYYPRIHFGWSELKVVRAGGWKWIESPEPELYDLATDPHEERNLAQTATDRSLPLRRRLAALTQELSRGALPVTMSKADPETLAKLASLGYLTGAAPEAPAGSGPLPAPKRKIAVYNDLVEARSLIEQRDFSAGERRLLALLRTDPEVVDAQTALGSLYLEQKRFPDAARVLRAAVEAKPSDPTVALALALAELASGKPEAAEKTLQSALRLFPSDSRFYLLLGQAADVRGDRRRAESFEARVLELEPRSASARSALSEVRFRRGDPIGALRLADEALRLDPAVRGAHYCRAIVLESQGKPDAAWDEYAAETRAAPNDPRAFRGLMALSRQLSRLEAEEGVLVEVRRSRPDVPLSYIYLARNYLDRKERLPDAIALTELAVEKKPEGGELALAYYLLADLYSRTGRADLSSEYAARGREVERAASPRSSAGAGRGAPAPG